MFNRGPTPVFDQHLLNGQPAGFVGQTPFAADQSPKWTAFVADSVVTRSYRGPGGQRSAPRPSSIASPPLPRRLYIAAANVVVNQPATILVVRPTRGHRRSHFRRVRPRGRLYIGTLCRPVCASVQHSDLHCRSRAPTCGGPRWRLSTRPRRRSLFISRTQNSRTIGQMYKNASFDQLWRLRLCNAVHRIIDAGDDKAIRMYYATTNHKVRFQYLYFVKWKRNVKNARTRVFCSRAR